MKKAFTIKSKEKSFQELDRNLSYKQAIINTQTIFND